MVFVKARRRFTRKITGLLFVGTAIAAPFPAFAHPHIFIDAKFEAIAGADGTLQEVRDVWHFDEVFSSSVLLDFDKNEDSKLDSSELDAIGKTVRTSLAKYNYYTSITVNGKPVPLAMPEVMHASYSNQSLTLEFSQKPVRPTPMKGLIVFGMYDTTLYTALDFSTDDDLKTSGPGFASCKRKVVRPGSKEILAENQAMLTTLFFNDPTGTNYSQLVATRLEVRC